MSRLLLPSSVQPSYPDGYAESEAESAHPGLWNGLQGLWVPALGPSGATLHDVSGRDNHGTLTDMDAAQDWVRGDPRIGGSALEFEGLSEYVDGGVIDVSSWTAMSWAVTFLATNTTGVQVIADLQHAARDGARLFISSGTLAFDADDGTFTRADTPISAGTWYDAVAVIDGDEAILYLDGVEVDRQSGNTFDFSGAVGAVNLAARDNGSDTNMLVGKIASASLYNRALAHKEIQLLHRQPLAPLQVRRRLRVSSSVTELYTREQSAAMATDDTDLGTAYSASDYTDVDTDNGVRVGQVASDTNFAVHLFKDYVGSQTSCTLTCNLQSDLAPVSRTVFLQIYNYNSTTWENVDTESAADADTDFTLTADIADLTNYKSAEFIACRVYQANA